MATGIDAIQTGAPVTATGGVLYGDTSVTLPTDATSDLSEDFTKGGFIGEDGVTRETDASDEKIRAWGGDTVKVVRSEHSITYSLEFLESANADEIGRASCREREYKSEDEIAVKLTKLRELEE